MNIFMAGFQWLRWINGKIPDLLEKLKGGY